MIPAQPARSHRGGRLAVPLTHEGRHTGQMALLRKYFGQPARDYT